MSRKAKGKGFQMRSGKTTDFKSMGSSKPGVPNSSVDSDDDTSAGDGDFYSMGYDSVNQPTVVEEKKVGDLVDEKTEENKEVKEENDGKVSNDNTEEENTAGNVYTTPSDEKTTTSDEYEVGGDRKEGDKWWEKKAFKDSGIGHMVDAVRVIRDSIKKGRAKRKKVKAIDQQTMDSTGMSKKELRKLKKNIKK